MIKQIQSVFAFCGIFFLIQSLFCSCIQEENLAKITVETSRVTSITEATATCSGIITADKGADVTTCGVCWSTSPTPTIENDTVIAASDNLVFTCSIKGLSPGTTYYVRAYAVNKGVVTYGLNVIFTTKTFSITTTSISLVTATSAIGGGDIISDGDSSTLTVLARGVCWNTFPSPTIENSKTTVGVGGGRFTCNIDSLTAFTTYYIRAYATNGIVTIYGNEVFFSTLSGVVELTTDAVSAIMLNAATSSGTISSDGGASVSERGICWSTSVEPTIANSKRTSGIGTGTFTANITGLTLGTKYFVRAYAINSVGIFYGNEISFSTTNSVTDIDGNVYNAVKIGTQVWMVENLKTTKYRNGELIGTTMPATKNIYNESTPKYQWAYNGDEGNVSKCGRIYTGYAVRDNRNIAPTGWHVATDADWTKLENYLIANGYNYDGTTTGNKIAKSLAATTDWYSYSGTGTIGNDLTKNNTSGFTALPGGYRTSSGVFDYVGLIGIWWSSTEYYTTTAWYRYMGSNSSFVSSNYYDEQFGLSVRCVLD